jgi:5-methylcytosine-specific restriction enzyme subunit McrC
VKVPIENIYYLLCYAWRFVPEDLAIDVGVVESPDVLNLCAHVLTTEIDRLLRRGIDRGYVGLIEEAPRLRGRVDLTATMTGLTWLNARAVCEFDELSPDVVHNRILRTTVRLLSNGPVEPKLRNRLRGTDHRLSGIDTIPLTASLFHRVQLHRNNSLYAFLMRVCELVHSSLLPDQSGEGPSWFRDVLSDEEYMAAVFEEFIRNFYSVKQSYFTVARTRPKWNATAERPDEVRFLPIMTTDVTLSSAARTIIIDAKYYRDALHTHSQYGSRTVHSANLYQLLAYLRGTAEAGTEQSIEGILVYPVGEQAVDLRFTIDAYPIRVFTLNLAQPWYSIETDLLNLVGPKNETIRLADKIDEVTEETGG